MAAGRRHHRSRSVEPGTEDRTGADFIALAEDVRRQVSEIEHRRDPSVEERLQIFFRSGQLELPRRSVTGARVDVSIDQTGK